MHRRQRTYAEGSGFLHCTFWSAIRSKAFLRGVNHCARESAASSTRLQTSLSAWSTYSNAARGNRLAVRETKKPRRVESALSGRVQGRLCTKIEVKLELKDNYKLVHLPARPVAIPYREAVDKELDRLLESGNYRPLNPPRGQVRSL